MVFCVGLYGLRVTNPVHGTAHGRSNPGLVKELFNAEDCRPIPKIAEIDSPRIQVGIWSFPPESEGPLICCQTTCKELPVYLSWLVCESAALKIDTKTQYHRGLEYVRLKSLEAVISRV